VVVHVALSSRRKLSALQEEASASTQRSRATGHARCGYRSRSFLDCVGRIGQWPLIHGPQQVLMSVTSSVASRLGLEVALADATEQISHSV
jgi:hypothetical protein